MNQNKGIALVFLTAVISGLTVFVSKYGVSIVNPYIFTGLKNILVAFFAVGWLLMARDWRILRKLTKKQWSLLLIVGLIGGCVPFLLYFKGLSLTNSAQAAFIHKSMFLFIFILAAVFLKEKISKNLLIIANFIFLGNILFLKLTPIHFGWGDFLILLATLLWAVENVLSKYLLKELPARIIIWARMFFGSVFIIFFWLATNQARLILTLSVRQVGWVMITSVLLLSYVATWYLGLKYVNVSTAAAVLLLAAPITLFFSNGLALAPNQIAGMILIGGAFIYAGCQKTIRVLQ